MRDFNNLSSKIFRSIDTEELKSIISENLRPSLKIVILIDTGNWNSLSTFTSSL